MQRNHHASALLRACRQVPDWWTVGGRSNPYAIEFVGLGSATDRYSKTGSYTGDEAVVMWLKPTATIANGVAYGVFSIYDSAAGADLWSLRLEGDTVNGNTLNLLLLGTSAGKALNIGTGWSCVHINFNAGVPELFLNGVSQFVGTGGTVSPATNHVIGLASTAAYGLVDAYAYEFIIDEVALFSVPQVASTIYNSGVPLDYDDFGPDLIASYEVEKSVGSITANTLSPRYPEGTSEPSFVWGSATTTGVVETTTDALRSSDTNAFKEMCTNYGDYVRGTAVGGATPLGTGVDLPDVACGLMPYPAGAGFSTLGYTGAFIGNHEEPQATPEASTATTAVVDSDSTTYAAVGGTASLGGVVDARAGRLFLPLFVKR